MTEEERRRREEEEMRQSEMDEQQRREAVQWRLEEEERRREEESDDAGSVYPLVNTTASVTSSQFSCYSLGAINMEGGNLTIFTSLFSDNSPNHYLFPSACRNIHCSDEGQVKFGSLHGGDEISTSSFKHEGQDIHTRNDRNPWLSLPELTQVNGGFCPASCQFQAWSTSCTLAALYDAAILR
ncbi:hypothetical protein BLNAU_2576 [Blattamonas nauphoetae]|uniref:Glycogen debranching enzyme C-terminal domain-containing protein n=1 Tax=Blattamonas nauphoetae TaxID=2049346 RepID=A0ABQ9YF71_9EUKA|nr:hypothetical protein BLNAU_2576 [Blattamonas nauphoetae]